MIPVPSFVDRNRAASIWGAGFVVIFLLSLLLFFALDDNQFEVVLFFPTYTNHRLTGEERFVPRHSTLARNVETVVEGMILGPELIRHNRVISPDTRVRAVFVHGGTAIVDLSPAVLFPGPEVSSSFDESVQAIKHTVQFNFPAIRRVVVTVAGQEPSSEVSAHN